MNAKKLSTDFPLKETCKNGVSNITVSSGKGEPGSG